MAGAVYIALQILSWVLLFFTIIIIHILTQNTTTSKTSVTNVEIFVGVIVGVIPRRIEMTNARTQVSSDRISVQMTHI